MAETSAGVVYLGVDAEGRQASVAVLNRGAAGDAAARDRFRAAIEAAWPGSGAQAGEGDGDAAPVVAAQPDGVAPWVATRYDADRPDRVGAERFLDSVLLRGSFGGRWNGRRRGPQFQPYWLGAGEPALGQVSAGPVGVVPGRRSDRPLVAAIVTLVAVLGLLGLLLVVLFACQPRVSEPPVAPQDPPSPSVSPSLVPPPTEAPRPSPSATSPSPSSPSPGPSDGGEGEDGGPV
ncbi:hypothetical protein Acsp04_20650 [Actinomadura sp. NBRC 104425]|nr:hypothetical protein Acsp04_20650 [Actinomadura sp. NBRC 104425]